MGTAFRGFIAVGRLYQAEQSRENMDQVLRQLDVLMGQTSSATDLQFFDPRDLLIAESLTIMVDLLLEVQPEIVQKLFFLLQNLGCSPRLQEYLCCHLHLHSSLAVFLQTYGTTNKDQIVTQCLKLLELYTYHAVIPTVESSMEYVLEVVFKEIQNNFSDVFIPCMGILSNLSRNNPAIVSYIKAQSSTRRIMKILIEKLSCSLQPAFLHAMITLFVIMKGDPIRNQVFSSKNTCQALEMAIQIFSTEELSTQRTAADLLRALLTCPLSQNHILQSSQLENVLTSIWQALIKTKSAHCASNLLHLLLSLFSYPELRSEMFILLQLLPDVLECLQEWGLSSAAQDEVQQADVFAWQLLKSILQEICLQEQVAKHKPFITRTLNLALPTHLKYDINFESPDVKLQLLKTSNILEFILVLSENPETQVFLRGLKSELCRYVITSQMENHSLISDKDCSNTSLEIVISTLSIMKNLVGNTTKVKDLFAELLQGNDLMPFLANSLMSKTELQVQRTLEIIFSANNLVSFPSDILAETITSRNQMNQTITSIGSISTTPTVDIAHVLKTPKTKRRQSLDNSVQLLISKLESGLEVKDFQSSEIMEMYENKVDVLTRQMQELQKLLEAKTIALQQSDKFLSHYRCVQGQHEAEVLKIRNLLKDSERKSELAREQTREVTLAQEGMALELKQCKHNMATLHQECEELNELNLEVTQRLKSTQQQVVELQSNCDSLKEMNTVLQKHVDNIQQKHEAMTVDFQEVTMEKRSLLKQVKEKDQKIKDLSISLNKYLEDLKSKEKNLEISEKSNSQLKERLGVAEKTGEELRLEGSSLRKLCSQIEKSLLEKTQELRIANEKLAEQQKLTDGIMSLLNQRNRN